MNINIVGKNVDVSGGLRKTVEEKLGKLEKYFSEDTKVNVTLSVDKERHKIEVTIPLKGKIIRSEQVSNDMYVSIDLVEEVIERAMDILYSYGQEIVTSEQIGEAVLEVLSEMNEVAYVRYTSVFRKFKTLDEFEEIIRKQRERTADKPEVA